VIVYDKIFWIENVILPLRNLKSSKVHEALSTPFGDE
jgi:hypothetical protein